MCIFFFLTISQSSHFKLNYSRREIPSCFPISAEFRTIKYFYTISITYIWPPTPWDSQFVPQWAVRNCKNQQDPDSIFYQLLQLSDSELIHYINFIISFLCIDIKSLLIQISFFHYYNYAVLLFSISITVWLL